MSTRRRLLAALAPLALLVSAGAGTAAAAPARNTAAPARNTVVRADAIAETLPLGYHVTAVALEYRRVVHVDGAVLPPEAFTVTATLDDGDTARTAPRTVVGAYLNDAPERTTRPAKGRFLILELSTADANAQVNYYTGITHIYPLVGAYAITQVAGVYDRHGRVELPADPVPVLNAGVLSPVVDNFTREAFTSRAGVTLGYRMFRPAAYRAAGRQRVRYPLVLALHGFGERGTDNTAQLAANQMATAFATPERQATDPAFVVAPQAPAQPPPGFWIWNPPEVQAWLLELVGELSATYPVDTDRIYLTGLSMGSIGGWDLIPRHPDVFAGAVLVTGFGDPGLVPAMKDVPVWATHSADDTTVGYDVPGADRFLVDAIEAAGVPVVRGEWAGDLPGPQARARASALWQRAREAGAHTLYTTFSAGTTPVNPHFSWVPTYGNPVILDWLFSNTRHG